MSTDVPVADNRVERVLAMMVAATVALSIIAFFAVLIGSANGAFAGGETPPFWGFVFLVPLIGLPIGFVLLITLLIVNGVRRSRASRRGSA